MAHEQDTRRLVGAGRPLRARGDRGAVLVEYVLVLGLLLVGSFGVIELLNDRIDAEVDNQADCISTRPPPPSCQPRAVTTSTTIIGPPTSNSTTTTVPVTPVLASLTWESSAVIPLSGGLFDAVTFPTLLVPDDLGILQPVVGATIRVEVYIVLPPPESTPFFMDCVTDNTGRCELRFTTPAPGVERVELRNPTVADYPGEVSPIPTPPAFTFS